jgi:hypothetical protein
MIERIASKFGDNILLSVRLENNESLKNFAFEFCHTFDVKVTSYPNTQEKLVNVLSNRGIPLGDLSVIFDDGEPIYVYQCEGLIRKDKSSARSNEYSRDSGKIRNLIKSLKVNGEIPTEDKMVSTYRDAIQSALKSVGDRSTPYISVESSQVVALIEKAMGYATTEQLDSHEMGRLYAKYLKQLANNDEASKDMQRYAKGCTVVKLPYHYVRQSQKNNGILIGDVMWDGVEKFGSKDIKVTKPFERFDSIADSPISAVGTMIRTYFEGNKKHYNSESPLGVDTLDKYYKDIDISTSSSGQNFIVLIPHHAT